MAAEPPPKVGQASSLPLPQEQCQDAPHGNLSFNTVTGNFSYTPAAAYTGADSFNYTITNGFGSSTATVKLTVANKIWYIDNSVAANGDGRSSSPFKQTSDFTTANDGAAGHLADNDLVFLRQGNGLFVGISRDIAVSTDGVDWTQVWHDPRGHTELTGVAYGGGTFNLLFNGGILD